MEELRRNGKGMKKEEGREKGKEKSWLSALTLIPSIHISMHGCHAYHCRDDFKHDDQRKSHSAPHYSIIWDFT